MTKLKAIKLRLYPSDEQSIILRQHFGNVRFIWNKFVKYERINYSFGGKFMKRYKLNSFLKPLKKRYPFLNYSDKFALESVSEHMEMAYLKFFKGQANRPNLKHRAWNQNYTTLMASKTSKNLRFISKHYFKIPKFKEPFRISACHIPHGRIRRATIEMKSTGKYFLVVLVNAVDEQYPKRQKVIGLDAGLRFNQIMSNGLRAKALHFNDLENQIKVWSRKFNRRKTLAKNRVLFEKHNNKLHGLGNESVTPWQYRSNVMIARKQMARLYAKIKNRRYDFLQKWSTWLIQHYDIIKIEKLNVKSMLKNHHLAHAISLQGWSMFKTMLIYKAVWYGKEVQLVKPAYTTQQCSNCGYICNRNDSTHIGQEVEEWTCSQCQTWHDRDINAAINIRNSNPIKIYNAKTGMNGLIV